MGTYGYGGKGYYNAQTSFPSRFVNGRKRYRALVRFANEPNRMPVEVYYCSDEGKGTKQHKEDLNVALSKEFTCIKHDIVELSVEKLDY